MSLPGTLCLLLFLSSCTSAPKLSVISTESPPIPAALLAACRPPLPVQPFTWQASLIWNEQLLHELEKCNHQLAGIRKFEQDRLFSEKNRGKK
ncbi:Rz1-like lysis system protein LysC [Enterobacter bugandensis]|uniref:Rz1-like lysis system protein LysC n=1 Tax=Enterobacter bugandensis TaxID=881260 RepID=UPI0040385A70